jgi:hypothetical protein
MPRNLDFEEIPPSETGISLSTVLPNGWFVTGTHPANYKMGADQSVFRSGRGSATIRSKTSSPTGFGTLMQMSGAERYRGKRVRMTGYIKATNVQDEAGLWLRANSGGNIVAFGHTYSQQRMGTSEWAPYAIVLDIPAQSKTLAFGLLLEGPGQVWLDDVTFEILGLAASTGTTNSPQQEMPRNLDFEEIPPSETGISLSTVLPNGWFVAGSHPRDYEMGADQSVFRSGRNSATIQSRTSRSRTSCLTGFGTLMQMSGAEHYRGKRVRMTGYIKATNIQGTAGLWLRADGGGNPVAFGHTYDQQRMGTSEWTAYTIVLDIPAQSDTLAFGLLLNGPGQIWLDDATFEILGPASSMIKIVKPKG